MSAVAAPASPSAWAAARLSVRAVEEAGWIHAISSGEVEALSQLWARYRLPCLHLARRVLGGDAHSQDVVQLVLLDVWRHAGRFDPARASVGTWILTMTHHKAVDRVRYERRRPAVALEVLASTPADGPTPTDAALATLRRQKVRRALATLSAPQRETLVLAYFGGLTYLEIANQMGVPVGTVKTRGRAGMVRLRALLGELREAD